MWEGSTTVVYPLSLGEVSWFDDQGETRRCDWSKTAYFCMRPV